MLLPNSVTFLVQGLTSQLHSGYFQGLQFFKANTDGVIFVCFVAQEAQTYSEDTGLLFMETSAKTAMNVNELFLAIGEWPSFSICKQMVEAYDENYKEKCTQHYTVRTS